MCVKEIKKPRDKEVSTRDASLLSLVKDVVSTGG
jgi:hypothetical protein